MNPADAEKLLGGYATGTLSEAERAVLFRAALDEQRLFDALADEEALRELLTDPATRRELIALLAPKPGGRKHWWAWVWRPVPATVAVAALALTVAVLVRTPASRPVEIASAPAAKPVEPEREARAALPPPAAASRAPERREPAAPAPAREAAPPAKLARNQAPPPPAPRFDDPPAVALQDQIGARREAAADLQTAPPPPPPPAPRAAEATASKAVIAGPVYRLELRDPSGEFQPAPPGEFAVGASVRLVIENASPGTLTVRLRDGGRERIVATRTVRAGERVIVPAEGGLDASAGTRIVSVEWGSAQVLPGFRARSAAGALAGRTAPIEIPLTFR